MLELPLLVMLGPLLARQTWWSRVATAAIIHRSRQRT